MPLREHLLEFRNRLYIAVAALIVATVFGWIKYEYFFETLTQPYLDFQKANPNSRVELNFGYATAAFSQRVSLSLWVGVIASSPIWLWQLWAFVLPGLTRREKRISLGFFAAIVPLFLGGCYFGFILLPKSLNVLFGFTPPGDLSSNIQQVDAYFKFVTRFILAFGATWLLPVVLVALTMLGMVRGRLLFTHWRPAVLIIFIIAAVVTPTPDPVTMFLMGGPLMVLYFVSATVCVLIDRRRQEARPDWLDTPEDQASPLDA